MINKKTDTEKPNMEGWKWFRINDKTVTNTLNSFMRSKSSAVVSNYMRKLETETCHGVGLPECIIAKVGCFR